MAAAFYVFRVKDASGAFMTRPWGVWCKSRVEVDRAAVAVSRLFHGPGTGHVVRKSTAKTALEHFGAPNPSDNTVSEAVDAAYNFDELFGTKWYVEICNPDGKLTYSEGGRTFDQVLSAVRSKGEQEVARFSAPSSASSEQISQLEALGLKPA